MKKKEKELLKNLKIKRKRKKVTTDANLKFKNQYSEISMTFFSEISQKIEELIWFKK